MNYKWPKLARMIKIVSRNKTIISKCSKFEQNIINVPSAMLPMLPTFLNSWAIIIIHSHFFIFIFLQFSLTSLWCVACHCRIDYSVQLVKSSTIACSCLHLLVQSQTRIFHRFCSGLYRRKVPVSKTRLCCTWWKTGERIICRIVLKLVNYKSLILSCITWNK